MMCARLYMALNGCLIAWETPKTRQVPYREALETWPEKTWECSLALRHHPPHIPTDSFVAYLYSKYLDDPLLTFPINVLPPPPSGQPTLGTRESDLSQLLQP